MSEKDWIMEKIRAAKKRGAYHHGNLKAQLIEATRALVEEKGPDHFSVSEACRRAGVSTAAPYKHFKDKTEMLHAVAIEGMQRQQQQMLNALAPYPEGSRDRIIAMGRVYVDFAMAEPGVFRLMFALAGDHDEDTVLVEAGDTTFSFVQMEVAKARGRSEIGFEDRHRAFLLWSFVHGLSFLKIDGKLADDKMPVDLDTTLDDIARRIVPEASAV
ncbi:MAG: TetR/AcrR family transcriptional regulator [Arenibacterium sp.]